MSGARATTKSVNPPPAAAEFVTVVIGDQIFGIPIHLVQDVFAPQVITRVPLSPPEVAGVLNLRGRIVTAIDVRARLGMPARTGGRSAMAVGIDHKGESYGLVIDQVGEVMSLPEAGLEDNPSNLDARWRQVSLGVYRLEGSLLIVLDVARLLEFGRLAA